MADLNFEGTDVPEEVQGKLNEQVGTLVKDAVQGEVSGLKSKNDELLGKLNSMGDKLKAFDGIDPEKTKALYADMEKNKDLQMLKDGKLDELVAKKVDGVKATYEDKLKGMTEEVGNAAKKAATYKSRYENQLIGEQLGKLALEAKVLPSALDDVVRRARDVFVVTDSGELEARNAEGALIKNEEGDLMTPARFIETLKKGAPHYWPPSKGAGFSGDGAEDANSLESRMAKAAKDGDMDTYDKLRAQSKKKSA